MEEIIAARIGTYVTNDPRKIIAALEARAPVEFMGRTLVERVGHIVGGECERLAKGPAIMLRREDGEYIPVSA